MIGGGAANAVDSGPVSVIAKGTPRDAPSATKA